MKNLASSSLLLLTIIASATAASLTFLKKDTRSRSPSAAPVQGQIDDDNKENKSSFFSTLTGFVNGLGSPKEKDFSDCIKSPIELPKPISLDFLGFIDQNNQCSHYTGLDDILLVSGKLNIETIGSFIFCPNVLKFLQSFKIDEFMDRFRSSKSQFQLITVLMLRKATLEGKYSTQNRLETFKNCMQSIRSKLTPDSFWPCQENCSAVSVKENFIKFVNSEKSCKETFGDKLESYAEALKKSLEENKILTHKEIHQAIEGNLKTSENLVSLDKVIREQVKIEELVANKIETILEKMNNEKKVFHSMAQKEFENRILGINVGTVLSKMGKMSNFVTGLFSKERRES